MRLRIDCNINNSWEYKFWLKAYTNRSKNTITFTHGTVKHAPCNVETCVGSLFIFSFMVRVDDDDWPGLLFKEHVPPRYKLG